MSDEAPRSKSGSKVSRRMGDEVRRIPLWTQKFLIGAIVVSVLGVAGQIYAHFARPEPVPAAQSTADAPPGSRGLLADGARAAEPHAEPAERSWSERLPAWATGIGVSFVIGFLIGWVFRAFIKTMIILTLIGGGGLFALSYFNVLDVDWTAARTHYDSGVEWMSAQGTKLKDVVLGNLPSAIPGALGALLGLRRR